jgi:hypothetical protein
MRVMPGGAEVHTVGPFRTTSGPGRARRRATAEPLSPVNLQTRKDLQTRKERRSPHMQCSALHRHPEERLA